MILAGNEDIKAGMLQAKESVMDITKFIVNIIAIPILCMVMIGFLIFFISKAVVANQQHDDNRKNIIGIISLVIGISVIMSAPFWMWTMIGMGGDDASSVTALLQWSVFL